MGDERLTIAQVSPFAWEAESAVGRYIATLSGVLRAHGHRVLVVAPSRSPELVAASRRALHEHPQALLERAAHEPVVIGVGEVLPLGSRSHRRGSLPLNVARTIEEALSTLPLDIVHVHEPFAPSASSIALRAARALSVGSFHGFTERMLSIRLGRTLAQRLFSRLDARTVSYETARELMQGLFPADYSVILPGAGTPGSRRAAGVDGDGREGAEEYTPATDRAVAAGAPGAAHELRILLVAEEERAALRGALRALRALPAGSAWRAAVWCARPLAAPLPLGHRLQGRVRILDGHVGLDAALADADVLALASAGVRPAPNVLLQALAAGAVPVASALPIYAELLSEGRCGLLFAPGDAQTLCAALARLAADRQLLESLRTAGAATRARLSWDRVADQFEVIYTRLVARRHDRRARNEPARRQVAKRPLIDVDLHMHTDHSFDCATPAEVLLAQAAAKGLGAIAVTEHNEISGGLAAAELAAASPVKVIVGEEVKTAEQGEVIGLFIREKIERGMTLQETIAEIKRQGGIVYVPHPFDRMHSVPDYRHLLDVIDDVDVLEVFNPRVAIREYNQEAVRFAAKYRLIAGAGSDAHVPQGLGSVRIRMHDFDGPDEFLEALRDADIVRNPASLLYVQALKFLQTKALPAPARRASRERRVRRVARR